MNGQMLDELIYLFRQMHEKPQSPLILLRGEGKAFSAGADLNWMAEAIDFNVDENIEDSRKLYQCFDLWNRLPVTTIAWLNGPAIGGATGLAAAADFVWVASGTSIRFSEVKLGLVPATVAPFVLNRIGLVKSRQWMLTAKTIDVPQLLKAGFADQLVEQEDLPDQLNLVISELQGNDLQAMQLTVDLLEALDRGAYETSEEIFTAKIIAKARTSESAQERIRRFLSSKNITS